ncbi:GMC oxidoreductase [Anabaena subtropica]|uniref:Cholesterol oxidase n=1 Tax=Anabaena subtropica FACHB-260 TaxID=2692884 RepID=A0ABR8CMG6_9NOST|nr:GMC oxidoreductase [Anabaena subtropica]MBD2344331.1 GMC family oxidoreductase [Anabaena subtropica FACHB-260]
MVHMRSGRRRFLQNSALFTGGLLTTSLLDTRHSMARDEPIEAVVIGSGYGGSVAALRLAQAGINTLVIERGRRWPITSAQNTFTTFRNPDGRAAWLSPTTFDGVPVNIYTGVLESNNEDGILVLRGAGVGGGSLVNNAGMVQPRNRGVFNQVFSGLLKYEDFTNIYYPRVRSIIQPSPIPNDILSTFYYDSTRLFVQEATRAGFSNYLLDLAVDWDIVREEIAGRKTPSTINGEIWYGCNSGAKRSLDHNYLSLAEKTGLVEILPLHVVTSINEVGGYGYRITCDQINEFGEVITTKYITCRYLFLAAGSLGTSKLLVKAKTKGTLPRLNDYVGKFWGTNGDAIVSRSNLPVANGKGGFAGAILEDFNNPKGPNIIMNYPDWNGLPGTQEYLAIGLPKQYGSFRYDASLDDVRLHLPRNTPGDKALMSSIESTLGVLDERNSTSTQIKSEVSYAGTAHPLGGCRLGKACDEYGRVLGYRGLYVVDGALLPGTAACANPALTIAALAERCVEKIIAEDINFGQFHRRKGRYNNIPGRAR